MKQIIKENKRNSSHQRFKLFGSNHSNKERDRESNRRSETKMKKSITFFSDWVESESLNGWMKWMSKSAECEFETMSFQLFQCLTFSSIHYMCVFLYAFGLPSWLMTRMDICIVFNQKKKKKDSSLWCYISLKLLWWNEMDRTRPIIS